MRSLLAAALLAAAPASGQDRSVERKVEVKIERDPKLSPGLAVTVDRSSERPRPARREALRHYQTLPARDEQGRGCELQIGPADRVAQEGDVVVRRGEVVDAAFALHGSVTVDSGGVVEEAVAVGGAVTVEGRVQKDAVAIRGEVVIRDGGLVGGDAVALGGRTRIEGGGKVAGDVTSIGPGFFVGDIADLVLKELGRRGPCRVKVDPAALEARGDKGSTGP